VQLERAGVDARGKRKAAPLELAAHALIEVQRERARRDEQRKRCETRDAEDFIALPHARDSTCPNVAFLWRGYL
jgi:hypothetical protein